MARRKVYVIYDERAILGDTDNAQVLESCGSLDEAKHTSWDGKRDPLGAVYEYDLIREDGQDIAVNEMFIGTVPDLKT